MSKATNASKQRQRWHDGHRCRFKRRRRRWRVLRSLRFGDPAWSAEAWRVWREITGALRRFNEGFVWAMAREITGWTRKPLESKGVLGGQEVEGKGATLRAISENRVSENGGDR